MVWWWLSLQLLWLEGPLLSNMKIRKCYLSDLFQPWDLGFSAPSDPEFLLFSWVNSCRFSAAVKVLLVCSSLQCCCHTMVFCSVSIVSAVVFVLARWPTDPSDAGAAVGTFEHRCQLEDYGFHLSFCRINTVIKREDCHQQSEITFIQMFNKSQVWLLRSPRVWWYPVCQHNDVSSCCWSVFRSLIN